MAKSEITFRTALSFLLGTLLASALTNIYEILIPIVLGVFLFIALSRTQYLGVLVILAGLLSGSIYYYGFSAWQDAKTVIPYGESINARALALNDAESIDGQIKYSAMLQSPYSGKVAVVSNQEIYPKYGDVILARGKANTPRNPYSSPLFIAEKTGIIESNKGNWIKATLFAAKRRFVNTIKMSLPKKEAALATGLTVGERTGFSKEDKLSMSLSGTTHLVALSGYNIAILVMSIETMLRGRLGRKSLFFATVLTIFVFVVAVGGESSVVRAAIMGGLVLLAKTEGRESSMHIAIAFSAFVMAIENPFIARFDVGFQLSFLSLIGIVYLSPLILYVIGGKESFTGWKENLAMSVSAQLMVLPVSLTIFGSASATGVFANLAITTFIPITMFVVFLSGTIGTFLPLIGNILSWIARPLLGFELWIINAFAIPEASIKNPFTGNAIFILYYALIAYSIYKFRKCEAAASK